MGVERHLELLRNARGEVMLKLCYNCKIYNLLHIYFDVDEIKCDKCYINYCNYQKNNV